MPDHRKAREANQKAIEDRMMRIRQATGQTATDQQVRDYAKKRAEDIARKAANSE